ncbi:MAG: hypothetical protein IKU94_00730 [Bacteroidaceae bacterium]|nr:hypothetical protein [Bacteroidaceae bacterium]MBR4930438.1 hypothetical protein [Bacteroidaceae bacterium]
MAENNTIMQADLARVRMIDFNAQFTGSLRKLVEVLGVTRKIAVQDGAALKMLTVTGVLESGDVAEGELIPLSKYETEEVNVGEVKLNKWRKATTAEAILKGGYDQAVGATTDKMLKDIQKGIRTGFFNFMATGTGTASGADLQSALANGWGVLATLFEDDAVESVYFLNPMDVADYLGAAQVTMQTAFGMTYIENFLGLGTVFLNSSVPKGKFYATAKDNVVMYFVNVANGDVAASFGLTTDETGYIGINEYPDNDTARVLNLVMSGVTFFPERKDGIVVGTITGG